MKSIFTLSVGLVTVKPKDPGLNSEKLNRTITAKTPTVVEKPGIFVKQ